jgi:hypothetical protein
VKFLAREKWELTDFDLKDGKRAMHVPIISVGWAKGSTRAHQNKHRWAHVVLPILQPWTPLSKLLVSGMQSPKSLRTLPISLSLALSIALEEYDFLNKLLC